MAAGCISRAEKYRKQMNNAIEPLNMKLRELLGDGNASVFYQPSDGWCVLFSEDHNAPVGMVDFDALFQMPKDAALAYLAKLSI